MLGATLATALVALATHNAAPLLEVVVTTCCGRDVRWLGDLFSFSGWVYSSRRLSLPASLGRHAHLLVYDKGGNESTNHRLLRTLQKSVAFPQSVRVVALPNANGREAHTIAHHMAESWDHLAALTTFVQGDVKSDHAWPLVILDQRLREAKAAQNTSSSARAIVERLVRRMHTAPPSSGDACLCRAYDVPPLLCDTNRHGAIQWPCPHRGTFATDDFERVSAYFEHGGTMRAMHTMGGYSGPAAVVMRFFLREATWPGMAVPWCNAGSLSVTAQQARSNKPQAWWRALRQLVERDGKIKWISALRMAHVFERLWLRIFSQPAIPQERLALPACFDDPRATCCTRHEECCCPTRRRAPKSTA